MNWLNWDNWIILKWIIWHFFGIFTNWLNWDDWINLKWMKWGHCVGKQGSGRGLRLFIHLNQTGSDSNQLDHLNSIEMEAVGVVADGAGSAPFPIFYSSWQLKRSTSFQLLLRCCCCCCCCCCCFQRCHAWLNSNSFSAYYLFIFLTY